MVAAFQPNLQGLVVVAGTISIVGKGMNDRIIELESKFSFQEDTIAELNEVVIRQQRQLDDMALQMTRLAEQLEDIMTQRTGGQLDSSADEKPPHY